MFRSLVGLYKGMKPCKDNGNLKFADLEFIVHNKSLQHRSGTSCLRWTVFKSRFCGFAAQNYSTKPQL